MKGGVAVFGMLCALLGGAPSEEAAGRVLVFSKTAGFRHDSIPDGIAAVRRLGEENGFAVEATEDAAIFQDRSLGSYAAVVFLNTTGDVLNEAEQQGLEGFLRSGKGFVGVHSASDTEYRWAWYGALVGAYFKSHPAIQPAEIRVTDRFHSSTRGLPALWRRADEWYNFQSNPRGRVHVLATLEEATYSGGEMGADHPISWCQFYEGGRAWYTALGHTRESYSEPLFLQHLLGGIRFAAGVPDADCRPTRALPPRPPRP